MSFKNNFGKAREIGRNLILPVKKINQLVKNWVPVSHQISCAVDFGAGTLIWSKWLREFIPQVIAVDTIYESNIIEPGNTYTFQEDAGIICAANIESAINYISGDSLLWVCDVIHHLPPQVWEEVKDQLYGVCEFIVIKDIDANYKFGNFMNRLHDRIINGESIYNVNPIQLMAELKRKGYQVEMKKIHKLWYPHFLILARKK